MGRAVRAYGWIERGESMNTLIFFFVAMTLGLQVVLIIALDHVNNTVLKVYELVCNESDKILEEMNND